MRKVNRTDIIKMLLVLALVAGVGVSMAAIGRFTPTHAIVEPVYCGSCHPDQVRELNATTHLPHFMGAILESGYASSGKWPKMAEAVSGGCMMCHNTWNNRQKMFVSNYVLNANVNVPGDGKNSILTFNDVITTPTGLSAEYQVPVDNITDQFIDLSGNLLAGQTIDQTRTTVTVSAPGTSILAAGTPLKKDVDYTTNETGVFLKSGSNLTMLLDGDSGSVDVNLKIINIDAGVAVDVSAGNQLITLLNPLANLSTIKVTVDDPGLSNISTGTALKLTTDYTNTTAAVTLLATSVAATKLSMVGPGVQGTVNISYTTDTVVSALTNPNAVIIGTNGNTEAVLGTNINLTNIVISVQDPAGSGLKAGKLLTPGVDYTVVTVGGVTSIDFDGMGPVTQGLIAGKGTVKIVYGTLGVVADLKKVWGDLSALSPQPGAFLSDNGEESCGNVEKGFCHAVEKFMGLNINNKMLENQADGLGGQLGSGNGIFFQHEMAYTSAEYAAKQVKFCGVCHFNKLPPMTADGEPIPLLAANMPQVTRVSHGVTYQTNISGTSSDWAHRQVQCIRCHGHAGISNYGQGVTSN